MNYLTFEFELDDDLHEIFIAELMDLDFYGFEQFDNRLIAYVEKSRFNDSHRELIEQLVDFHLGTSFTELDEVEEQNWNATWEKTIQPRNIGRFLVKPTWAQQQPTDDEILLEIDPKMAFGTGYHATTRLALLQLSRIDFSGKQVMDAGTGTGILAIAAIKLGAKYAVGFDIDPWSKENAAENAIINQVEEQIDIRFGGTELIRDDEIFDVTLANINRNVILEIIPFLVEHTTSGGTLLLTGLLETDEEIIRERLSAQPVQITDIQQEEEWILFQLEKHRE